MTYGRLATLRRASTVDMPLLIVAVLILTLGLVNLYSATSVYVNDAQKVRLADYYVSQIYWIVIGVLFAIVAATIDYRYFERFAPALYGSALLSLGLVFVLSADIRGSARWIKLGNFSFQPSEFMKIVLIFMVARCMHEDTKTEPRNLVDLAIPALFTGLPVAAVMAQPDLGTSLIYALTSASMLVMIPISRRSILVLSGAAAVSLPTTWHFLLRPYQKARITSFLNPEADRAGTGWHALQSQTAVGNGQILGEGFMQGTQNQFGFLPDQYSDFPFAVFAEDWGFLGCTVLIALYGFVCLWAIHVAAQAKDRFGVAIAIGSGALIFWHVVFNIGMATGVLPVVGITLPLFSYGGSSMLTMLIALGLIMNVSVRR